MDEQYNRLLTYRISRREFLRLFFKSSFTLLVAWFMNACGIKPSQMTATKEPATSTAFISAQAPSETPRPESVIRTEIIGQIPGDYSDFVKENNLIPRSENIDPETKTGFAIELLKNYQSVLENSLLRQKFKTITEISSMYPISIPNDWDIFDVLNTFAKEIDSGKTTVMFNPEHKGDMGTTSTFEYQNNDWIRKTTIMIGPSFMGKGRFHEGDKYFYSYASNLDLVVALIHEYAHALQDEMAILHVKNDLSKNQQLAKQVGQNVDEFTKLIRMKAEYFNTSKAAEYNTPGADVNEAQANALIVAFTDLLNTVNNSPMPGNRRFDRSKDQTEELGIVNLYKFYYHEAHGDPRSQKWIETAGK